MLFKNSSFLTFIVRSYEEEGGEEEEEEEEEENALDTDNECLIFSNM